MQKMKYTIERLICVNIIENKLENKITIEGYVKDLNNWYKSNDCIISNSTQEGTQTSIVEGVSTGCSAIIKQLGYLMKSWMKKGYLQTLMN